jgi:ketosteroid isomerase-like protein
MPESAPVEVVRDLFEAFGRADLPAVIGLLADDVDWWVSGPPEIVPHAGRRVGKDEVMGYFTAMEGVEFEEFTQSEWIEGGENIVVLAHQRYRVKATGRPAEFDLAMVFTVRDGKVARFRSYEDTNATVSAFWDD